MAKNRTLIRTEAFRVNASRTRKLVNRKRRIQYRLRDRHWSDQPKPMFTARNVHYELADRARGLGPGGIGGIHLLARRTGLIEAIDQRLHLLKVHLPYHESDHVLNIAYNILAGGTPSHDNRAVGGDAVRLTIRTAGEIAQGNHSGVLCPSEGLFARGSGTISNNDFSICGNVRGYAHIVARKVAQPHHPCCRRPAKRFRQGPGAA